MELLNALSAASQQKLDSTAASEVQRHGLETVILLLAPFVPHVANELWEALGHDQHVDQVEWPTYSEDALEEEQLLIVVQVNGKMRGKITVAADATQARIETEALAKVAGLLDSKKIQRVVHVPRRLVNIVVGG